MLDWLLSDVLLRKVPEHLLNGVNSGQLKVYGSIIRSVANGQIRGFLQETSGLAKVGMAPASLPVQAAGVAIDVAGHTASFIQNEQIKAAVQIVQRLGIANIALTTAGILASQ